MLSSSTLYYSHLAEALPRYRQYARCDDVAVAGGLDLLNAVPPRQRVEKRKEAACMSSAKGQDQRVTHEESQMQ